MSIYRNSKGTTKGRHDAVVHCGTPSPAYKDNDWVRTNVYFHGFTDMPQVRSKYVRSPTFCCLGYEWSLRFYPRGDSSSSISEEMLSVYLTLCSSSSIKVEFGFAINDFKAKTAGGAEAAQFCSTFHCGKAETWGHTNFTDRKKALASVFKGALVIEVRIKPATNPPHFIPDNPSTYSIIQDLFNDGHDADVVFIFGGEDETKAEGSKNSPTKFYAHKLILKKAAPQLAELCSSDGSPSPVHVEITSMAPNTFKDMLLYTYGLSIPDFGENPSRTKEIIKAADMYGMTNLKLEAEAYYVASLSITVENVLEHLLFADAMNCALLKEAVMDYVVTNSFELLSMKSLESAPSGLLNDALAAMARKGGIEEAGDMFISELRRKCFEEGLDYDGSREMLTAALAGDDGVDDNEDDEEEEENDDDDDDEDNDDY